jgi:curved DNA-binding protein CbpA
MSDRVDYYGVLGVAPDSEDIVIRAAYRVLMQKYHPDKWPDVSSVAESKAREINEAYAVLSDPQAKSAYDANRSVRPGTAAVRSQKTSNGNVAATVLSSRAKTQHAISSPLRVAIGIVGLVAVLAMVAALASRDHYRQSDAAVVQPSTTEDSSNHRSAASATIVPRPHPARTTSKRLIAQPDVATRTLAGMLGAWKLEGASDCEAVYRLAADGNGRLTFTGPDGTQQRESVQGMDGPWLHAAIGDASSFYRLEGRSLVYRYASVENGRSETRFSRCG